MKQTSIVLGGVTHNIPPLAISQIEQLSDMFGAVPPHKIPFAILKIALARAEKPLDSAAVDAMPATMTEVTDAVNAILADAGFDMADKAPSAAEA
jgi:hypothetical protein